ncbi:MAG TPA: HD domain-containing phosphohydrolase [Tepidisphaeraceae bacterium]|nr:HD domain-containing phosphohydrolase [Tepidisphaeraceae bacterium]
MRILIVDDQELSLDVLRFALEHEGHEVQTARNGHEALAALNKGEHHLVISDWDMPEMDGLDLCRSIRIRELGDYVYFILLTARDGAASIVNGLASGADDFITKPFDPDELTARVRVAERILSLNTRDMTIFALAKLAESRDPETGQHLERVQSYSRRLAQHLCRSGKYPNELDAGFVNLIYDTSPLHDIGKVAIPDCVLLKPGRLSDDEFQIMKTHTTMGARTLEAAARKYPKARYLKIAREIAESHHEQWDGGGYPNGLTGGDIPLAARIVALADVYDALVSRRVYKGSFSHQTARAIILEGQGTHFDPAIVDAFLAVEAQFVEIQKLFSNYLPEAA